MCRGFYDSQANYTALVFANLGELHLQIALRIVVGQLPVSGSPLFIQAHIVCSVALTLSELQSS
jgi:hypothetical protein